MSLRKRPFRRQFSWFLGVAWFFVKRIATEVLIRESGGATEATEDF